MKSLKKKYIGSYLDAIIPPIPESYSYSKYYINKYLLKIKKKLFPKEEKVQLLWSTWNDVCDLVGKFKNGTKGEYVDGNGNIADPSTNLIGFYHNNNGEGWIIQQGDWIIKDKSGKISYMTDEQMNRSILIQKLDI